VQIISLSLDTSTRRIVLMLDSSGSMEASPQKAGWGIALPVAGYAVDVMPSTALTALVTFSDKLQRQANDFQNPQVVGTQVQHLIDQRPKGRTLLFDAIHQVVTEFTELRWGDAIYVVTDGDDNKSTISHTKLRRELIARGIRVFAFLVVWPGGSLNQEGVIGASRMEDLAEFTGGDVVRVSASDLAAQNRAKLNKSASHIVREVESVYRMELGISPVERAAGVRVSLVHKSAGKGGAVVYSHEIAPCPSAVN
jgi:Mg-chelatase subunit ChlD